MSGEKMGTNDCAAGGRREANFISINVNKYHGDCTAVTSIHWGGGTNSFCQGGDVCKLECEIEIFPALQQVNFNR